MTPPRQRVALGLAAAGFGNLLGLATAVALTLLGLLAVTFFIGRVIPVDPVLAVVGDRAPPAVYERARQAMGLDLPLYEQFWRYSLAMVQGDFGRSVRTANLVLDDIRRVFPATVELATLSILIGTLLGIPMGVGAAVARGRWLDQVVRVVGLIGYSVPIFWLGLMGLLVFYVHLGLVGGPGRLDAVYTYTFQAPSGFILADSLIQGRFDVFANALSHILLPAGLLGLFSLAYISRMTRSLMLEQLGQEYVTAARVKGLPERLVIWRHALGNALVPLVTVVGLSYAGLLEGSVLTEIVFSWPGLGQYITYSLQSADMNAVLGGTFVVGLVFIGLNLLSDGLYRLLDPRTR